MLICSRWMASGRGRLGDFGWWKLVDSNWEKLGTLNLKGLSE